MDIKQLQYFLQICEEGNFTKAASTLYITQQALSASMARLENEIGCILIKRNTHGIILTDAGKYFKEQAQKITDISNETMVHINSITGKKDNLMIGCSYGVVEELTGQLMDNPLLLKHKIQIGIMEYPDCDCERAVENGDVDAGFAIGPVDNNKFDSFFLISRRLCFLVKDTHPLAKYNTIKIRQLQNEKIILMNDHFKAHHIFRSLCKKDAFEPRFVYEAGEIAPIQDLVLKNYGIGLSVDFVANKMRTKNVKVLYADNPAFVWDVYLIIKKEKALSKETQLFVDCIKKNSSQYI